MIINFNVPPNATMDQMIDEAARITETIGEEITNLAEFNVSSMVGANLTSNAATNIAMQRAQGDVVKAREILPSVISEFNNSIYNISLENLQQIESGVTPKKEIRGTNGNVARTN